MLSGNGKFYCRKDDNMMSSMELSLYPLRTDDIEIAVKCFIAVLKDRGLNITTGPMSSMVCGESAMLFSAISEAYEKACADNGVVLIIKVSNVCLPDK